MADRAGDNTRYLIYRQLFENHQLPLAYIDLEYLEQNIATVLRQRGDKRIRLASKSMRSVGVLKRLLASDAAFQGVMAFTPREALYLASQGIDDIVLGYPFARQADIRAIAEHAREGRPITQMVDSVEHVDRIEAEAKACGVRLPIWIDLDMATPLPGLHFGSWRSGIAGKRQLKPLLERIIRTPHVVLEGVMGYEAQISGVIDQLPGRAALNRVVRILKAYSARVATLRRRRLVQAIRGTGVALRAVNGGGTGSMKLSGHDASLTEMTIGSALYGPTLFDHYRDYRYQPAVGFALEIVRSPRPGIYTCLGGGYIASGAVGAEKQPTPYLPYGSALDPLEGAGEVQTPVHYAGLVSLALGDPIFFRHAKAGEICEHFPALIGIRQGNIVETFSTYRGDGQCFL